MEFIIEGDFIDILIKFNRCYYENNNNKSKKIKKKKLI